MDKSTGYMYAILHQGTSGTLGAHTMAGRHMLVLLRVLGPASGVCPSLLQDFPEVVRGALTLAGGGGA